MNAAKVIERTTLRHFPSEIVSDGFSEALKIRHFLGGHALRPLKFGRPRRSIHSSCAYTSKSHAMPLKVRVFHLAISRRANGTSMLVVRRENSPIQSCSFRLVISENTGASSVLKLLYNIPVVHLKKLYLLLVMSHENKKAYINDGSENINLK